MNRSNSKSSYQLLIIDFLAFGFLGLIVGFLGIQSLTNYHHQSESLLFSLAIPTFLFLLIGIALYFFAEYKFNHLKFKNIFLLFAGVIAITNIIAVATLPEVVELPNNATMVITPIMRTYYLLTGFAFALMPYFCFYVIPRKILNHRYMNIILYIVLGASIGLILLSPIVEWKSYVGMFNNHFTDIEGYALTSICGHKNVFARMLLFGIFATILLRIKKNDARWLLFFIPLYLFTLLTLSKIVIVVATLTIITYLIIRLVVICRRSRDNLIITLLISGLVVILIPFFVVSVIRSESGILYAIKNMFNNLGESAKATFESRLIIWRCAFELLKPYQYIFGVGISSFGVALCNTYIPVAPPFDANGVYHAHNFCVDLLGRGGIILLGIYLFLYAYLIYIALKLRRKTPWLTFTTIFFLFMSILIGIVEPTFICGLDENLFMNLVIIFPIMSEYYLLMDKDGIAVKNELVNQAKVVKKINFSNKLLTLNKKRLILEAKYIAYDLNNKIRL